MPTEQTIKTVESHYSTPDLVDAFLDDLEQAANMFAGVLKKYGATMSDKYVEDLTPEQQGRLTTIFARVMQA